MLAKLVDGPVLRDKQNWDKLRGAIVGLSAALPAFVAAIEALPQVIEWQDKAMDKRIRHAIAAKEARDAGKATESAGQARKADKQPKKAAPAKGKLPTESRSSGAGQRTVARAVARESPSENVSRTRSVNKRGRSDSEATSVPTPIRVPGSRGTAAAAVSSSSTSSSSTNASTSQPGESNLQTGQPQQGGGAPQGVQGMPQLTMEQQQQMWAFFIAQQQGQGAPQAGQPPPNAVTMTPLPYVAPGAPQMPTSQVAISGAPPLPPGPPPNSGAPQAVTGAPAPSDGAQASATAQGVTPTATEANL